LQNRFATSAFAEYEHTNNNNTTSQKAPVKSNLFFDKGNDEEDLIFGSKKQKEEIRPVVEHKKKEEVVHAKQTPHQENFLDYNVNTNNVKNTFFDEGDLEEEMLNKSQSVSNQPVTGENARAKTPQNEKINQVLNPESGATQNELNLKNNLFDENEDDNLKNTFTLIGEKAQKSNQKLPNLKAATPNPVKIPEKKIDAHPPNRNILPPKINKQTAPSHNTLQKNDNFANFDSDSNFDNIFDSLASAPSKRHEDKKTNYFDEN